MPTDPNVQTIARGGRLVQITRPDAGPGDEHASETALDDYMADFEIDNRHDLETLAVLARGVAARA